MLRATKRSGSCCAFLVIVPVLVVSAFALAPVSSNNNKMMMNRKPFLERIAGLTVVICCGLPHITTTALAVPPAKSSSSDIKHYVNGDVNIQSTTIAYKQLSLAIHEFPGVHVPVACWFPVDGMVGGESETTTAKASPPAYYQHRISIRRIGQLLAGWNFIPEFAAKEYQLTPISAKTTVTDGSRIVVVDGNQMSLPTAGPVVLLAHGYLGSRFDLSHLAEALACVGFICLAAEYPESLAASYDRRPGLDRTTINENLLTSLSKTEWNLKASSYGIVGHSLGCGTVLQTGDDSWARVSIAGFPRTRDGISVPGHGLLLVSTNDGAVTRMGGSLLVESIVNDDYQMLREDALPDRLPRRAALVYDRPNSPNHISFLSENVNDAMIDFLSPLLPVAQALQIPVLDFDRYQLSRDSLATATVVHPLIVQYLKQEMLSRGIKH